jgi:hypothetical protein
MCFTFKRYVNIIEETWLELNNTENFAIMKTVTTILSRHGLVDNFLLRRWMNIVCCDDILGTLWRQAVAARKRVDLSNMVVAR